MGIDHSNPYIHCTTVLCDSCKSNHLYRNLRQRAFRIRRRCAWALHIYLRCASTATTVLNFAMRKASVLYAILLSVISLQLQSARGSPLSWSDNHVHVQAPLSASTLIDKIETFVKVRCQSPQLLAFMR